MQKHITAEDLYGTAGGDIYSTGTTLPRPRIFEPAINSVTQDIYGTSVATTMQDIYSSAPTQMNIYGTTAQLVMNGNTLQSGGDINGIQKSDAIPPLIVSRPSVLPAAIPPEASLASGFINLSSTRQNDQESSSVIDPSSCSNTAENPSSVACNPSFPVPHTGNQSTRSTTSTFVIPQPSKFSPVFSMQNKAPGIKVETTSSRNNVGTTMQGNFTGLTSSHNPQTTPYIPPSPINISAPVPHQPSIPIPSIPR